MCLYSGYCLDQQLEVTSQKCYNILTVCLDPANCEINHGKRRRVLSSEIFIQS